MLTNLLHALIKALTFVGYILSGAGLIALTILITLEVTLRYFFGYSMQFAEEYSGYLLVMVTFFGANHSLKTDSLLRVDFLYARLPPGFQKILSVLYDFLCCAFCIVLTWYFAKLVSFSFAHHITSTTISSTPLFIPQLAMPLGMGLMALTFLLRAVDQLVPRG